MHILDWLLRCKYKCFIQKNACSVYCSVLCSVWECSLWHVKNDWRQEERRQWRKWKFLTCLACQSECPGYCCPTRCRWTWTSAVLAWCSIMGGIFAMILVLVLNLQKIILSYQNKFLHISLFPCFYEDKLSVPISCLAWPPSWSTDQLSAFSSSIKLENLTCQIVMCLKCKSFVTLIFDWI